LQGAPDVQQPAAMAQNVVVFSSVNAGQIAPVLEAFTAETGTKTQLVVDEYQDLARRFGNHGNDSGADLLFVSGLADLSAAAEADLFRPTYLGPDDNNVPANLQDPDSYWLPLGVRARVIVYNTTLVSTEELATISNFASLAEGPWHARLCISSSRVPGNRALIAQLISDYGKRDAELTVRAWRASLGERFFNSDIDLLQAVVAGDCQLAIADTSALATLMAADRNAPLAVYRFPDTVPILLDISGAGVTRHAANPDGATVLLQWLRSQSANTLYAASGYEFPVHKGAPAAVPIQVWIDLVADPMQISGLTYLHQEAALLAERARYP
jgi:iron(III) transport system substrate-binding protein